MTTYRAAVKYPVDASDNEKIQALREGIAFVAAELIDMGCSLEYVEAALDDALSMAQEEYAVRIEMEGI